MFACRPNAAKAVPGFYVRLQEHAVFNLNDFSTKKSFVRHVQFARSNALKLSRLPTVLSTIRIVNKFSEKLCDRRCAYSK